MIRTPPNNKPHQCNSNKKKIYIYMVLGLSVQGLGFGLRFRVLRIVGFSGTPNQRGLIVGLKMDLGRAAGGHQSGFHGTALKQLQEEAVM